MLPQEKGTLMADIPFQRGQRHLQLSVTHPDVAPCRIWVRHAPEIRCSMPDVATATAPSSPSAASAAWRQLGPRGWSPARRIALEASKPNRRQTSSRWVDIADARWNGRKASADTYSLLS